MNSRERLLTAFRGGTPDRVPVVGRPKFLCNYFPDIPNELDRYLKYHEDFGTDIFVYTPIVPLPCHLPTEIPWRKDVEIDMKHYVRDNKDYWERTIHTPEGDLHDVKRALIITEGCGSGPEVVEPLVKNLKRDIPLLRYMHPDLSLFDNIYNEMSESVIKVGDRGVVNANLYSPIDCRSDVMKQEDFLMLYFDDKEAFREIVQIGADAMMAETKRVLEIGLKVIKTWWFYCSPSSGWSPQIYEEMFLPHLVKQVELVHSYPETVYLYYDDGKMKEFVDLYVSGGIDVLMTLTPPPMGNAEPSEMKRKYGDKIALMGGVDFVNELCYSTPEKIRRIVKERLEIYKPGGGYILDGSNKVPYETPVENLKAFVEAGKEFGQY